jgi:hypothetical protein
VRSDKPLKDIVKSDTYAHRKSACVGPGMPMTEAMLLETIKVEVD